MDFREIPFPGNKVNKGKEQDRGLLVRPRSQVLTEISWAMAYIGWAAGPYLITLIEVPEIW